MKKLITFALILLPPLVLLLVCGTFVFALHHRPPQEWLRAGLVSKLPASGEPVSMIVYKEQIDAWTRHPDVPICNIFVRKDSETNRIVALPGWHAGELRVSVSYDAGCGKYVSGCWNEEFNLEGQQIIPDGYQYTVEHLPQFPVRIKDGQIWVHLDAAMQ